MTHGEIHNVATRLTVLEAAADKFAGEELPFWDSSEYMNGICSVIADAFGTLDPENARSEIWDQIKSVHREAALKEAAPKIASRVIERKFGASKTLSPVGIVRMEQPLEAEVVLELLTAAALEGLKEKKS